MFPVGVGVVEADELEDCAETRAIVESQANRTPRRNVCVATRAAMVENEHLGW